MHEDAQAWADKEASLIALAHRIDEAGASIGLPFVAASADIANPVPMLDADGNPMAETIFKWVDPDLAYWKDRSFALRARFVNIARTFAEPFYSVDGVLGTWRENSSVSNVDISDSSKSFGVRSSIVCPCHLPLGVIGSVVWASDQAIENLEEVFAANAERLYILTLKFIALYHELHTCGELYLTLDLTRREIQCLKWAAAGKTDGEISIIMGISTPTVRFHLKNASQKFGVTGRSQAIHHATRLGFVGQTRS